jgi:hypothetical protein
MINILYEPLPVHIEADGVTYPIITDFREWLRFSDMVGDDAVPKRQKLRLMLNWLYDEPKCITGELVTAIFDFYKLKALKSEPAEYSDDDITEDSLPKPPVLNWSIDAPYIIGDFQRYYGIDLFNTEMHWWKFHILLSALPEESQMMKRIGYRSVDLGQIKNESERKRIMKMKQLYALPFELDDEDIGAIFGGTM